MNTSAHMKKYFLIFAAVAILGMLAIYFLPNKKASTSTDSQGSQVATSTDNTDTSQIADSTTDTNSVTSSLTTTTNSSSTTTTASSAYKDGSYAGKNIWTEFGNVKIGITISGGKITDVNFISMPNNEDHSAMLSEKAEPILKSQTLTAQSTNIDGVSGATHTSQSYIESLQAAIDAAKS